MSNYNPEIPTAKANERLMQAIRQESHVINRGLVIELPCWCEED